MVVMRTAIYARVSLDKQETENQIAVLRKYCQAEGHEIVIEYVDEGFTGKNAKRPAFQQMLKAARNREFDLLLFWSLDRLSREGARETLNHLEWLTFHGVAWRSHTESYLDSAGIFKDVLISIMGTLAKQERIKISERTKAGLARVKAKGLPIGRQANTEAYERVRAARADNPAASERALARAVGCSNTTVKRALKEIDMKEPAPPTL